MNIIKTIWKKLLDLFNIHADENQKWLLISLFVSGFLITSIYPATVKITVSQLPAQWIAFQNLATSVAGLLVGMIWKGKIRKAATKYFLWLAMAESFAGFLLGMYLCFIQFNVWVYAICGLIYSTLISTFVGKCVMAFEAKLWSNKKREIFDNNHSVVAGMVCILGFALAMFVVPSIKVAMFIWGLCCIIDDIGWIIVYSKNYKVLHNIEDFDEDKTD